MAVAADDVSPADSLNESSLARPPTPAAVQNQGVEAFKDVAIGSIAGILGKLVEYPFDTIKVRLQSQSSSSHAGTKHLNGPLDALAAAWRSRSGPLRSLYRGISAPLLGAAVETSSLFFSYRIAQDIFVAAAPSLNSNKDANGKIQLPFTALLGCGAASGAFTSVLLTPIELIKCKMQVPVPPSHLASELGYGNTKPAGPVQLIRSVSQSQGILGFWHGQLGTLIRETGGSAAWFGSYESVKLGFIHYENKYRPQTQFGIDDLRVWQQMVAGATAGMAYNFVFYPADTIKSRMQTEETGAISGALKTRTTFLSTGKELWHQQGLRGFYRGCGITVFRSAPSSAIIFSIYETLRRYFGCG